MTPERRRLVVAVGLAYVEALAAAVVLGSALDGRSPLFVAAAADVAATLVVFGASARHDNSSLYDPYWSVAPFFIVAFWLHAAAPGASLVRGWLVAGLVAVWAVRLTANCLARWRTLAHEDFRYVEIRRRTGRAWWLSSLVAIHLLPTTWVFLGLLPLYPAVARPSLPLGWLDGAAALVTAGAIALEATADLQLRRFLAARADPGAVLDDGLWALSRHPNYLGEVLFWWGLWLFGLAADPSWWWTVAGPLAITALFALVSVPWMDRRLEAGHPGYRSRHAGVPGLLPRFASRG